MICHSMNSSVWHFIFYSIAVHSSLATTQKLNYRYHHCGESNDFTSDSSFPSNLNTTLSSLYSNATRSNGFYNSSAGQNPDKAYGLFLCGGGISPQLCQSCVRATSDQIKNLCPNQKEAYIWYDECMLRYSNRSIFSNPENRPLAYLWSLNKATDPDQFNITMQSLMRQIVARAEDSGNLFATGYANASVSSRIYGLAQCTLDISSSDCRACLSECLGFLPICCNGRQGGRVLTPSCNIRFETYPNFYESLEPAPTPPPITTPLLPPQTSAKPMAPAPAPPPITTLPPPPPISAKPVAPAPAPPHATAPPPPQISATPNVNGTVYLGKRGISSGTITAIVIPIVVILLFLLSTLCYCLSTRKAWKKDNAAKDEITSPQSLQFDLSTVKAATKNFLHENKIGEGGFGHVYKGKHSNGQEVAVKRLSCNSGQGAVEFKNEVALLAKLEHRNLVRLLGFCLEEQEKILIYEFVPNKSLDYFLFDRAKQGTLDWPKRYKIIMGTVRGILYLHEDSQLKIIHRDLKASNVLLDVDLNPKISDFGMARIFGADKSQENTKRIVGTYGYMPPEYAIYGFFSVKSDVFSFGVLLLEIISGKKNTSFHKSEYTENLLSYAWRNWRDGTALNLMDPTLRNSCPRNEVTRCIHIGLLCVQKDASKRPKMGTVEMMLNSFSMPLPSPQRPAFFLQSRTESKVPRALDSDQSAGNSMPSSLNEMSISELYPRP